MDVAAASACARVAARSRRGARVAAAGGHEVRAGQPALDLRRQHLFRLPRAAPAARIRVRAGTARRAGHDALLFDAHSGAVSPELAARVGGIRARQLVVTTAPSYLFWRCAPPELRVPQETSLRSQHRRTTVSPSARTRRRRLARPSASSARTSPSSANARTSCRCSPAPRRAMGMIPSIAWRRRRRIGCRADRSRRTCGAAGARWPAAISCATAPSPSVRRRRTARAPRWRRRAAVRITARSAQRTISATATASARCHDPRGNRRLIAHGVEYVYFIDEIFLPDRLLEALASRPSSSACRPASTSGIRDARSARRAPDACRSRRASRASARGRDLLAKRRRLTTEEFTERLIHAKERVPFVQANLLDAEVDDPDEVERWREHLQRARRLGEQAGAAVSLSRLPRLHEALGRAGRRAWERAHRPLPGRSSTSSATSRTRSRSRSRRTRARRLIRRGTPADAYS